MTIASPARSFRPRGLLQNESRVATDEARGKDSEKHSLIVSRLKVPQLLYGKPVPLRSRLPDALRSGWDWIGQILGKEKLLPGGEKEKARYGKIEAAAAAMRSYEALLFGGGGQLFYSCCMRCREIKVSKKKHPLLYP